MDAMSDPTTLEELEARIAEVRRGIEEGLGERARELRALAARLVAGETEAREELRRLAHRLRGVLHEPEEALAEQAARVEQDRGELADLVRAATELAGMLERGRAPRSAEPASAAPRAARPPAPLRGLRVVALDDDPSIRRLLELSLTRAGGCEALVLEHARDALARVRAGGVDLLVLDAMMPEVTGLALYRAVREDFPELSVVFLSGASPEDLGWDLSEERRVLWIRKPFRPASLLDRLAAFVRRPR